MGSCSLEAITKSIIHARPTADITGSVDEYVHKHPRTRIEFKRVKPRNHPHLRDHADAIDYFQIMDMSIQENETIKVIVSGNGSEKQLQRAALLYYKYLIFDYSKRYIQPKES